MLEVNARGGCIILLDVPPGSVITLDGVTRVTPSASTASSTLSAQSWGASAPFHRGLWVIDNIRTSSANDFHLLVVRSGTNKGQASSAGDCRTLPVGFVLLPSDSETAAPSPSAAADLGYEWIFARRYNPRTEEISNDPVDDLTLKNLAAALEEGGELRKFAMSYDQFMGSSSNDGNSGMGQLPSWDARTSLVNSHFLRRCHSVSSGNKLVPSSESNASEKNGIAKDNNLDIDGAPMSYPPIPCIDKTVRARQLTHHSGTRTYLSKLTPEKRTWLLLGGNTAASVSPGEFVWKDVLGRYYGRNEGGSNAGASENDFLADVELSFIVFLFLECQSSLEHWRDAISMCSLSTADESTNIVIQHPKFFQKLLFILCYQLACIEADFFQDVEYSSGEKNFMVDALRRLCAACESLGKRKRDGDSTLDSLKTTSQSLRQLARDRFSLELSLTNNNGDDHDMEVDALWATTGDDVGDDQNKADANEPYSNIDEEEDEEDGPVVIPYDQIEASMTRSSSQASKYHSKGQTNHSKEYPLLYAAMSPGEDEVMACARILDDARDVSLVREAASYLEEVEAHRGKMF